jgi:putative transposase
MVIPNQKRVAVLALVDEFGVSQRRARLVVGQYRSTQRHAHVRSPQEAFLRDRIRALAVKYPRYGYRRVHVMLICDGYQVNCKRVQCLWRLEGLRVQSPKRRKPKNVCQPIVVRGNYPNQVWAIDSQFDETTDGRPVKILNVTDEFSREALATNAARRITAAGTMAVLDQIRELRGAPQFLRMDNGPESIAETLRDWCKEQNIQANYCDPGSPWLTVASNHSTRDSETNY